jgi:hypothetical protein
LREEYRMMMFENRVLRILGFKRNEKTEEWKRLQKDEFYDLCLSNILVIK